MRKMQKISTVFFWAISLLAIASCSDGGEDAVSTDGKTVGTSDLGDIDAEKSWQKRTDWDVALCNGAIRTNSGTSGAGKGGIMSSPQEFDNLDASAVTSFYVDADTVTVIRKGK